MQFIVVFVAGCYGDQTLWRCIDCRISVFVRVESVFSPEQLLLFKSYIYLTRKHTS